MTDKKVFKKFLKAHRAFKKYKRNITKLNKFVTYDNLQGDTLMISSAFNWSHTKEGSGYWENLDNLWIELVETESK